MVTSWLRINHVERGASRLLGPECNFNRSAIDDGLKHARFSLDQLAINDEPLVARPVCCDRGAITREHKFRLETALDRPPRLKKDSAPVWNCWSLWHEANFGDLRMIG